MNQLRIVSGILALLFACQTQVGGDDKDAVKSVVEKAIKAAGGEDKLLRTFRWKESYFIGDVKTGTPREAILQPPDKWYSNKKNIAKGNDDRLEKTYLVWAWTLVPLTLKDSKLTLLPEIKVDDKPAVGLRLSRPEKPDISLYFDKESGQLARIDWRAYNIFFSDWKETDGFKYPSKAAVKRKDGTLRLRTEFGELERLKALPEGLKD